MSRTVKFLGIDFEVVSEQEQADADPGSVYLMTRVSDVNPALGSPQLRARRQVVLCDSCHKRCWFDPKSFGRLSSAVTRLCAQCLIAKAAD